MPMTPPWSSEDQPDGSIVVSFDGAPRFTLKRSDTSAKYWEVRREGEVEVIACDQYRADLFTRIRLGKIK